ncbi:hypothetical protein FHT86_000959 [Rhizobium sp. BK313]|nr:hypothetical protein [Rhizobium sp. BK313]
MEEIPCFRYCRMGLRFFYNHRVCWKLLSFLNEPLKALAVAAALMTKSRAANTDHICF